MQATYDRNLAAMFSWGVDYTNLHNISVDIYWRYIGYILGGPGMPNLIQHELTDACIQAIIRNDNLVVQVL